MKFIKIFYMTIILLIILNNYSLAFYGEYVWPRLDSIEVSNTNDKSLSNDTTSILSLESESAILIEQNSRKNFI